MLSSEEKSYYERQLLIPYWGEKSQQNIQEAKVVIVGAGGLGSPALTYLATAGVGNITVVDFDEVSITNLHRQVLYQHDDIGKNKSGLAATKIQKHNPFVTIKHIKERVNHSNFNTITDGIDILIDCSDNFETKFFLHDQAFKNNINLIHGNVHQFSGEINLFNFQDRSVNAPCYRCLWKQVPPESTDKGIMGPTAGIVGSMLSIETIKFLAKSEQIPYLNSGVTLLVDLLSSEIERISWTKNSSCQLCH